MAPLQGVHRKAGTERDSEKRRAEEEQWAQACAAGPTHRTQPAEGNQQEESATVTRNRKTSQSRRGGGSR